MKIKYTNTLKFYLISLGLIIVSCNKHKTEAKDEQIIAINATDNSDSEKDSLSNSINGNVAMNQIASIPSNVILTGLSNHRLVSIYKNKIEQTQPTNIIDKVRSYSDNEYVGGNNDNYEHYMPGIDVLYGYKLLNISHYDFASEKQNLFFNKPVLIKTLYYPSYEQDSLNKQPINRSYYFVSVYDEDTNRDTLLNKKDLRHFYLFDENASNKTALIPLDYSVLHSQYDYKNDMMYLFAKWDENKNGKADKAEPIHVFWINLKNPQKAKRLY